MEKKTLNILSIDIDYILEPCIALYEGHMSKNAPFFVSFKDQLDHGINLMERWRDLEPLIDKAAEVSQENYAEVVKIFTKSLFQLKKSDKDKIYFADHHDTICTALKNLHEEGTRFNIVNLDHHHDIYYSEDQLRSVDLYNLVSPGDWIWYLDKAGVLEQYHWISNGNSTEFVPLKGNQLNSEMITGRYESLAEYQESEHAVEKFDFIYVCRSPQWTPNKFHDYFHNLKEIADNYFKTSLEHDTEFFCGNRRSRPFRGESKGSVELDKPFGRD